jgi:hypothetical protein
MWPKGFIPTRAQWNGWTLPSKLTAISAYVGVLGFALFLIDFLPTHLGKRESPPQLQISNDPSRPKELLPQAFYLNHDVIPVRGFPFDLYLGVKLQDFAIRYGSLVAEEICPFPDVKLYRLKPGAFNPDRKSGWVNENATVFVFDSGTLAVVLLSVVVPPETEAALLGEIDRTHPVGFGTRYDQGSEYIWMSEKGHALELLSLSHGTSSGVNDLALMRTDFPLNDLLLRLGQNVPRIPETLDAFRVVLSQLRSILDSDVYKRQIYPQLGLAAVNRELSVRIISNALEGQ